MPTGRVFLVLALTTVLGVIGVLEPALARLALGFDLALVVACAIDWWRGRRLELGARRNWPELLVQGAGAEVQVELEAAAGAVVRLRDTLHPGLADAPQRTSLTVAGRNGWRYALVPRRRGEHLAGPLMARVLGPWRLAWSQRQLLPAEPRKVYPQVRWEGRVGHLLLLAHRRALGRQPHRLHGVGSEPYALREYLAGDPPNRIHWKASARHGRLVTREDTWESGARLIVLLDCARGMSGQDGGRSKLDHALAAALALVRVATARGDRVTMLAFSDRIERSLRLRGAERSVHQAYGALYDLEARLSEPAFDIAAETALQVEPRRATTVLLTSVVDLASAEMLRASMVRLERRHRPILVNLQDPELVSLAYGAPDGEAEAFAKVAALEILSLNRALATRLRHAGVRVVSPSADRLALEALESYLATFARR